LIIASARCERPALPVQRKRTVFIELFRAERSDECFSRSAVEACIL
jgi:hypothetical protein